jgi:hypothetical protein
MATAARAAKILNAMFEGRPVARREMRKKEKESKS